MIPICFFSILVGAMSCGAGAEVSEKETPSVPLLARTMLWIF